MKFHQICGAQRAMGIVNYECKKISPKPKWAFLQNKQMIFMRLNLTILFTILLITQVAAGGFAQKMSLDYDQADLKTILLAIKKKTGYNIIYRSDQIRDAGKISIHVKDASIDVALSQALLNTKLIYTIKDEVIVIKSGSAKMPANITPTMISQQVSINGKVVDEQGLPLIGASIKVKGTTLSTITNTEGRFTITVPDDGAILLISFVGYTEQQLAVGKNNLKPEIMLKPEENLMKDVVVVGYGTKTKATLTGAISTTSGKDIRNLPASSPSNTLAGRMAGVNVAQNTGAPGVSSSIKIRATGAFSNASTPLYVIDGVVRDQFAFDGLDQGEIDNISVLKDAASAAVYGARAANGVILVTTRRGTTGKTTFSFNSTFGLDNPINIPRMATSYEHGKFLNDAYDRVGIPSTDARYFAPDELERMKSLNYDWVDIAWKTPLTSRNSLDISGGTEKVHYFVSNAYYHQTGSFNNLKFDKNALRVNLDAEIAKNLTASVSFNLDTRNNTKPYWLYDSDDDRMENLYNALLKRPSWINPYTNGLPTGNNVDWHPLEILTDKTGYNKKRWNEYSTTIALDYKIEAVPGLSVKAQFNQFNRFTFIKQFSIPYKLYNFSTVGGNNHLVADNPQLLSTKVRDDGEFLYEDQNNQRSYQLNGYLNYKRSFGKHAFEGLFVYEQAENFGDQFDGRINYFLSPKVDQFTAGGNADPINSVVRGGGTEAGRVSFVGRFGYVYDDKYIFEASMRRDGSSTFPVSNRWGNFPSVSLGWRISKEKFFNVKAINELKIRASYGTLGNDAVVTNQWRERYFKANGAYFGGLTTGIIPGSLTNPNITWETTRTYNLGLDARMFNNQIDFTFEAFHRKTYDILGARTQSAPSTFGATFPSENYAQINSKGIEVSLGYNGKVGNNFQYFVKANAAYAVNKQIIIDEATGIRAYQRKTGFNDDRIFGYESVGILRTQADINALPAGYTILGRTPQLGMLNYRDIRGANSDGPDGKIDENDQNFIADHSVPPLNYGISIGFTWKNLSFNALFQGTGGYSVMQEAGSRFTTILPVERPFGYWADHWTPANPNAAYPAVFPQSWGYDDFPPSTFWLKKGAFLRLKNVSIAYNIKSVRLEKIGITGLNVFVNGTNLFLLQDNMKLRDPEASTFYSYPMMQNFSLGLNLLF